MEELFQSGKFTLEDENGNEIEYTTLLTFFNEHTNKNYVVYTDGTKDKEDNTKIFASTYNPDDSNEMLYPVENEDEWTNIYLLLSQVINENNNIE